MNSTWPRRQRQPPLMFSVLTTSGMLGVALSMSADECDSKLLSMAALKEKALKDTATRYREARTAETQRYQTVEEPAIISAFLKLEAPPVAEPFLAAWRGKRDALLEQLMAFGYVVAVMGTLENATAESPATGTVFTIEGVTAGDFLLVGRRWRIGANDSRRTTPYKKVPQHVMTGVSP